MRKCQTISFNEDVLKIVENYMQENNITFNKAVNEILLRYKKQLNTKTIKQEIKEIKEDIREIKEAIKK